MSSELYSVEQVADRLGLHVRTVRNYVRDGRLKATRIGRQYRIRADDLAAFTGEPAGAAAGTGAPRRVEVSSIVRIEGVDRATADRIGTLLTSAINHDLGGRLRVELVRDEARDLLTVVVLGDLDLTADLLRVIEPLSAL